MWCTHKNGHVYTKPEHQMNGLFVQWRICGGMGIWRQLEVSNEHFRTNESIQILCSKCVNISHVNYNVLILFMSI